MIATWANLPDAELRARLRALQMAVHPLARREGRDLIAALREAERDSARLSDCDDLLDCLPTVPRRHVLCALLQTLPLSAL